MNVQDLCNCKLTGPPQGPTEPPQGPTGPDIYSNEIIFHQSKLPTTILIINLDKDTDKFNKTYQQSIDNALFPVRIPAVNGRLELQKCPNVFDKYTTGWCNYFCTPSMIGIFLSHMKAWKYIVDNNLPSALIVEDDVILDQQFQYKIKLLEKHIPSNWDMIYYGCFLCGKNTYNINMPFGKIKNGGRKINDYVYIPKFAVGTHAYALTNKGAKTLLHKLNKVSGHVDLIMTTTNTDLNVYSFSESLIKQYGLSENSSNVTHYPYIPNKILDKITLDGEQSISFYLSSPLCQVLNYKISSWTFIFLFIGMLAGFYKMYKLVIIFLIFVIIDILIASQQSKATATDIFINYLGNLISMVLGFVIASNIS